MPRVVSLELKGEWKAHKERWAECTRCRIGKIAKFHVFFRGSIPCDVLFVGEGPGKSEDVCGEPFVGMAGKVLTKWIDEASSKVNFSWAITNVVACRPTDCVGGKNRPPDETERENCSERLSEFATMARPRVLVLLGQIAQEEVFYHGLPTLDLPHPSWILRQGGSASDESLQAINDLIRFLKENIR